MASKEVKCAHKASGFVNTKRLIICCDGTWNNTNEAAGPPSNVSWLSGAVAHKCCSGMPQIVYYHPGAGTETSRVARAVGGAFGVGVAQDIAESYRFICDNYNPGDEIVIVGFSRGAFTARSVGAMVCALGFLNRSGIDQLPHIFNDYQGWHEWHKEPYDEHKHLVGITFENVKKIERFEQESEESLAKKLGERKRQLYEKMAAMTSSDGKANLKHMADAYRGMLAEYQLLLCLRHAVPGSDDFKYAPIEGRVKAIGVWDTVGSLGIPEIPPFYHSGRGDREIRFERLDVHPRVEYAFHAVSLDEWRQAFDCTIHCNVGGGREDQQIATIALAWMADQLTSIGRARGGLGVIRNPNGLTSYPDWIWSYVAAPIRKLTKGTTDYITRIPGSYKEDDGDGKLVDPNELVHPCVRIRYLYGGLNLDDAGPWTCRALTERGYRLERRDAPAIVAVVRGKPGVHRAPDTYHSVRGPVTPYYYSCYNTNNTTPAVTSNAGDDDHQQPFLVKVEQPHEDDLKHQGDGDGDGHELPEEQIGMWERMFIKVNEKLVRWQETMTMTMTMTMDDAAAAAAAGQQKSVFGRAGDAVKSALGVGGVPVPQQPPAAMTEATKRKDRYIPEAYGYHDLVSWQKGDTQPRETVGTVA
ncbi:uncharacterized protein B0T15DRAFT_546383 [Chaetomium strumarium]|uniref:T6SS Phospholipase effector Tle1-like catalytic domain-containing protein n=1 Tax=Chaetomium strumarium TaxID=1170767 RepID=A0AAJ0H1F8_9PEZI|nr:hypothetical protein B0T15DRAFT_546383 [Chaetomium strumarium]